LSKILTDAACRKYVAGPKRRRIRDGGARSLFLIIEPSGHKSWQMRFRRPDGRPAKLTLGEFDPSGRELKGDPAIGQPLTVAAAHALATAVHRRRALGEDVIGEEKARKHGKRVEIQDRKESSFGAAVRDYIAKYAKPETRNWRETARLLGLRYGKDDAHPEEIRGGLAQRWADKDVRSLTDDDVWQVVDEARASAVPGIKARNRGVSEARARALFVALSSFFRWLKGKRRIARNPCADVQRPAPAKNRDRVLTPDEVRWFWQACDSADAPRVPGAPRPFAPLLRLLLVSGARLNEVAGMRRAELRDDGTWQLPSERTKNKRPHSVPLPPLARELIAGMNGKGNLIFTTNNKTPVSGWSRMKHRLDQAMLTLAQKELGPDVVIAPWRLHDLRRTAVTGMAELGVRPDVIELTVNHISGHRGGIAGVYNKSELLPERKAALERWAGHVLGLVEGRSADVVILPRRETAS